MSQLRRTKSCKKTSHVFEPRIREEAGFGFFIGEKEAIKIYELNLSEYPKSVLVYESLGETHRRNDDKSNAIHYF